MCINPCCSRAVRGRAFCPRVESKADASRVTWLDCNLGWVSKRCFALFANREFPPAVASAYMTGRRWLTVMSAALAAPSRAGFPGEPGTVKRRCSSSWRFADRTASANTFSMPPGVPHRAAHCAAARTRCSGPLCPVRRLPLQRRCTWRSFTESCRPQEDVLKQLRSCG